MALLQDLINGIDEQPVSALLRKVKVLAARLNQPALNTWASLELDGYPNPESLPAYRGPQPTGITGAYRLPYTNGISELPIPPLAFPADQQTGWLFKVAFFQPIAELEEFAKLTEGQLRADLPANQIAYINHLIANGTPGLPANALLVTAWRPFSAQQVKGVVDTVRSRLLDLALELEKLNPATGEQGAEQPNAAALQPIINNITAQHVNVAQNSSNFSQTMSTTTVPYQDENALLAAVSAAGVDPQSVDALRIAIREDREQEVDNPTEPGPQVRNWLGTMLYRASDPTAKIAISATGGVVAGLVKQFFHIS